VTRKLSPRPPSFNIECTACHRSHTIRSAVVCQLTLRAKIWVTPERSNSRDDRGEKSLCATALNRCGCEFPFVRPLILYLGAARWKMNSRFGTKCERADRWLSLNAENCSSLSQYDAVRIFCGLVHIIKKYKINTQVPESGRNNEYDFAKFAELPFAQYKYV